MDGTENSLKNWFHDWPSIVGQVAAWWAASPSYPLVVDGAVDRAEAMEVAAELHVSDYWMEERRVLHPTEYCTLKVEENEFLASPSDRRYSWNDLLQPDAEQRGLRATEALFAALSDGEAARTLGAAIGVPLLSSPATEITRYRQGHFLAPHADLVDDRTLGLILQVSPGAWRHEFGGEFGYRNEAGELFRCEPRFGRVSLLKFVPDASHWVDEVLAPGWARTAVVAHYRASS